MFKKNRKTEADGLSRGCEIFQQKNTCDPNPEALFAENTRDSVVSNKVFKYILR